jgi:uncharacterized protein YecA (UPF0149 family)
MLVGSAHLVEQIIFEEPVAQLKDMVGMPSLEALAAMSGAGREPGRNEPCPCGSGKKYKKCHGR